MTRQIKCGVEVRKVLEANVNQSADTMYMILGPEGCNVILDKSFGVPLITNDGITIAKEIEPQDPYENMGAQLIREVTSKANDMAEDGTTTATVPTQVMVNEDVKNLAAGVNPIVLRKGMRKAAGAAVEVIRKTSKSANGKEQTVRVAAISASDDKVGTMVADAVEEVSKGDAIAIEESKTMKTELDLAEGMQLDRGCLSACICTDMGRMEASLDDPYVLITDRKISNIQDLLSLLEQVVKMGARPLAITKGTEDGTLTTLIVNKLRGAFNVVAVKIPSYDNRRKEVLQGIAILIGGTVISEELGLGLKDTTVEQSGRAKSIKIQKEDTIIAGDAGDKNATSAKAFQICKQIEETTSDFDREKPQERLAKLAGNVAIIRVSTATEIETKETKLHVKSTLSTTRAAIEEGIVAGDGSAYIHVAGEVKSVTDGLEGGKKTGAGIILKALEAPLYHIVANTKLRGSIIVNKVKESSVGRGLDVYKKGYTDMIGVGALGPMGVTGDTLQNATSVVPTLLMTGTIVTNIKEPVLADPAAPDMGGMY